MAAFKWTRFQQHVIYIKIVIKSNLLIEVLHINKVYSNVLLHSWNNLEYLKIFYDRYCAPSVQLTLFAIQVDFMTWDLTHARHIKTIHDGLQHEKLHYKTVIFLRPVFLHRKH